MLERLKRLIRGPHKGPDSVTVKQVRDAVKLVAVSTKPIATHVRAGQFPEDWDCYCVYLDGVLQEDVVEVNTVEGWADVYNWSRSRKEHMTVTERLHGPYELRKVHPLTIF